MWDNITIHDLVFMSRCFQQQKNNAFDVLTFIQVRTDKNKFTNRKKIKMGTYK